jgi:hypothetical protein
LINATKEQKIDLIGKKINDNETRVVYSPSDGFDFGIVSNCHVEGQDSLFVSLLGDKETQLFAPDVPAGVTLGHQYTFPIDMEQGKTLAFEVILTKAVGTYNATIDFNYQVEGDELREINVPVSGEVVAPNLTYETNSIDFGVIPDCETTVESSFTAVNNTKIQIILEDQPTDSRIVFANLPMVFEPGDEKEIEFLYTPSSNNEDFTFSFWTFPCKDVNELMNIKSTKQGVDVQFESNVINFGAINACDLESGVAKITEELNITGGTATILSVEQPQSGAYSVKGINSGDVLSDNIQLEFLFEPPNVGTFLDSLVFTYEPCNIRKVIQIKGRLVNTDYSVQPEVLNFGFVEIGGESDNRTFTIRNFGEEDFVFDGFANLTNPPYIMIDPSVADFPITIKPFEERDFTFRYRPQTPADDTLEVILNISEPCEMEHRVIFNASSGEEEFYNLSISIPQDVQLEASKNGFIPVNFAFAQPQDYENVLFDTIAIVMSYNPTVILPQGIFYGDITNSDNLEIFLDETAPGTLYVRLKTIRDDAIQNGEIFRINAKALVGESQNTEIRIDDVSFSTYNQVDMSIETNDGFISVIGECDFENRLVTLDGEVNLTLPEGNILQKSSSLEYSIATSDLTTIILYDINGNKIKNIKEGHYQPGKYSAELDISDLSSGVYYIIMQSGISTRYEKIIILK